PRSRARAIGLEHHRLEGGDRLVADVAPVALDAAQIAVGGLAVGAAPDRAKAGVAKRRLQHLRVVEKLVAPVAKRIVDDERGVIRVQYAYRPVRDQANVA